ncbi:plasmid recombination protein (plasmid) [Enterococcus hirae]|uniref:MobV family relaxase n=1 Tax=Enterococcus TaxID=1350 RepID=UPI0020195C18|nr:MULTISPECIES: MobV family relaxase [Enterococcus]MCL4598623.1 plasmid recombination protein [Enterococcus hirae]UQR37865.1 plasmid recombination protein [Enterococcus hirae]WCG34450.1 plasmid recombination protein [Enterococcus dispar]
MSMIVARMQKMKAENLIGIGNHNQRKTKNHSNPDIDTSLSELNYDLVNRTDNYKKDIENFINENKSTTRAVRKDAVLINEWIITSDRKFFENLSDEDTKKFFITAKEYFEENFGEENIRYATVHLDESTPHLHMGIVPFDKDKKLSAKRVFNREALRNVQEDLPKLLQEKGFDIERGLEGSDRKNLTVPEFKKLKEAEKEIERAIDRKKNELKAYTQENNISNKIDVNITRETKDVKVPSGEKFLGHEFTKTVQKTTGNLIISETDFKKLDQALKHGRIKEEQLNKILNTDIHKENKELKDTVKELKAKTNDVIDDYNSLVKDYNSLIDENKGLRATISDLREEIRLIYISTKEFLKDRTSDLQTFKSAFKDLIHTITNKIGNSSLENNFQKEYRKETRQQSRGMER